MCASYANKDEARQAVWDVLAESGAARFPFPPHGRIPNFAGAKQAAERVLAHPLFEHIKRIKVNPDAPQRYIRLEALKRGITVFVPTPRLRGGFKRFDPMTIPVDKLQEAASLSKGDRWAEPVALQDLPAVELIVTGSVAVTRRAIAAVKDTAMAIWSTRSSENSATRPSQSPPRCMRSRSSMSFL